MRIRSVRKLGRRGAFGLSLLLVAPALGFLLLAGSVSAFTDLARDLGRLESNLRAPALGAEPEPVTGLQGGGVGLQKVPSSNPGQGQTQAPAAAEKSAEAAKTESDDEGPAKAAKSARDESSAVPRKAPASPPSIPTLQVDRFAPRCEEIYVYIVSDWVDGEAMATIATGPNARGYPKRIGARVGEYEVIAIGPTTFGNGPAVWLARGDDVCRAMLFDDNPKRAKKRKSTKRKRKRRKRRRKR